MAFPTGKSLKHTEKGTGNLFLHAQTIANIYTINGKFLISYSNFFLRGKN